MNAKAWNDIKSTRDLKHRTSRLRKKHGYLKFLHGKTIHELHLAKMIQDKPKKLAPIVNMDKPRPSFLGRAKKFVQRIGF